MLDRPPRALRLLQQRAERKPMGGPRPLTNAVSFNFCVAITANSWRMHWPRSRNESTKASLRLGQAILTRPAHITPDMEELC